MTIAYVYKWIHKPTQKWYIGSRTKKGCNPNDGYICSSKIVKPLIESKFDEWERQIIATGDPIEMIKFEADLLQQLDAKNNPLSFNLHNGDGDFTTANMNLPDQWVDAIRKGNKGKVRSEQAKENYRQANRKKAKDPEYLKKLRKPKRPEHGGRVSAALKGIPKTEDHKRAMSEIRKGKSTGPCSEERKEAIRAALKGKHTLPLVTCPHCGLEGRSNMRRWHFDNCKKRKI
jgi:hypothetical protein